MVNILWDLRIIYKLIDQLAKEEIYGRDINKITREVVQVVEQEINKNIGEKTFENIKGKYFTLKF